MQAMSKGTKYLREKLCAVRRKYVFVSLALCGSGAALLIPEVLHIFVYFSPLLVSTALSVVALFGLWSIADDSAKIAEGEDDTVSCGEESTDQNTPLEFEEDYNGSFIECVKELHESGGALFENMFRRDLLRQCSIKDMLMCVSEMQSKETLEASESGPQKSP
eukprot:TRINITY_DN12203_c0_g1_i1.p1 TRINITY_DN12203_c0_g1~~TRINITY_DN12203_c0_g1_i1.p1  ORF type:complete len:163 (+),score=12.78 TRINITY_DN12203_c0_g1_i1:308-796(+)